MNKFIILLLTIFYIAFPVVARAEVPKPEVSYSVKSSEGSPVVVISWTMPSEGNWGYRVYSGESEGSKKALVEQAPSSDVNEKNSGGDYIDNDVEEGQEYKYFVTAYNTAGEESVGSEVSVAVAEPERALSTGDALSAETGIGTFNNIGAFLNEIMRLYAIPFALIAALFMIIFAGYTYITSGGNQEEIGFAKEIIAGALLGLLTIFLMGWFIAYILPAS